MPNPRFTAHVVAHLTALALVPDEPCQFEILRLDLSVDTPLFTADDEQTFVEEAALDILADPEIQKRLKPDDLVSVSLAGVLNFQTFCGFDGTEYDMEVEPEWHYWRVLGPDEAKAVLEQEGLAEREAEDAYVYLD
jgi:hypothetical protein